MDDRIFELIQSWTDTIATDLGLVASAIEGHYTRLYRDDPSIRGFQCFMTATASLPDAASRMVSYGLNQFQHEASIAGMHSPGTLSIALQQSHAYTQQLRLHAARRFQAALVSRSSIAPARIASMKLLNRAGQQHSGMQMLALMVRKAAIDLYNEAAINGLITVGHPVARVYALDKQHPLDGQLISLTGEQEGLPTYADIQDEWFHPRSNALIGRKL